MLLSNERNRVGVVPTSGHTAWGGALTHTLSPLQGRNRPDYLKMLFEETDMNKDKEVSFKEFTIVLAKVTDDAHHIIHQEDRCKPDSN